MSSGFIVNVKKPTFSLSIVLEIICLVSGKMFLLFLVFYSISRYGFFYLSCFSVFPKSVAL